MLDSTSLATGCLLTILLYAGCSPQPASTKRTPPPRTVEPVVQAKRQPESPPPEGEDSAANEPKQVTTPDPLDTFRPVDSRPQHDDAQLAAAGIHLYKSKRLKLYTDIDPDVANSLPPMADQLYDALVEYFGPLPQDRQGIEFQMTGYLMRDEELFRNNGLMDGLPLLFHGKHQANQFWMREQHDNYYRRHLLLHECVHCFMTIVPGQHPPVWYMEGMAELFATHRLIDAERAGFRILPTQADDVAGWGRIAAIRKECAGQRSLTLGGVYDLPVEMFFQPESYAWSWGLCQFLDSHPRYQRPFRELGRHLHDGEFEARFRNVFQPSLRDLSTEWTLFSHQLQSGYDTARAAIEFIPAKALTEDAALNGRIQAARSWQDIGLRVAAGETWTISATGRFTLATNQKPWISEPQGISYQYFQGLPVGRLVACLDADPTEETAESPGRHLLHIEPIGRTARLTMPAAGRLLFRLNDAWDSLSDNEGSVEITVQRDPNTNSP